MTSFSQVFGTSKVEEHFAPLSNQELAEEISYELRPQIAKLIEMALTTLTTKHQEELERAVEAAYQEAGNFVGELYQSGNMGENEYALLTEFFDERITSTKTDKQEDYPPSN